MILNRSLRNHPGLFSLDELAMAMENRFWGFEDEGDSYLSVSCHEMIARRSIPFHSSFMFSNNDDVRSCTSQPRSRVLNVDVKRIMHVPFGGIKIIISHLHHARSRHIVFRRFACHEPGGP